MKSANKRIFFGFILLIAVFAISEFVSFRNLEKTKEISSRNAQIFQPSIIYLNELQLLIIDSRNFTESWVFFDITDHEDKNALRELHAIGRDSLTRDLEEISRLWENQDDEARLARVVNAFDSIMAEQQSIMQKLNVLEDYNKENWLVLIAVEGEHLTRVKQLSDQAKEDLIVLIAHMKNRSLEEKDAARDSFNSIQTVHVILAIMALVISLLVAWAILRFLRSEQQKKVITEERDEIKTQKAIIEEKNTEILSSISYAKRLQTSMLPSKTDIAHHFKDHFIYYKPRDIVSGDFYWYRQIQTEDGRTLVFIAAADATGHGVPGAFVSFICYSALNRAVDEFKLTKPCKILDQVSELVSETFSTSDQITKVYDGMDISLCVFDFDAQELYFAGANNPAYVIREGEMHKLEATRKSVGRSTFDSCFSMQEWPLQPGDTIYLFSDGFQDQFGGERGKKYRARRFQQFLQQIDQGPTITDGSSTLEKEFNTWRGKEDQVDDVLVIGLRV